MLAPDPFDSFNHLMPSYSCVRRLGTTPRFLGDSIQDIQWRYFIVFVKTGNITKNLQTIEEPLAQLRLQ